MGSFLGRRNLPGARRAAGGAQPAARRPDGGIFGKPPKNFPREKRPARGLWRQFLVNLSIPGRVVSFGMNNWAYYRERETLCISGEIGARCEERRAFESPCSAVWRASISGERFGQTP